MSEDDAPKETSFDEHTLNYEAALRAHERDHQFVSFTVQATIDIGIVALRSAVLIAGGSVVVGLAFVTSIYTSAPGLGKELMQAVVVFSVAVVFAGSSAGFSYLSQHQYAQGASTMTKGWEHPYIVANTKSKQYDSSGHRWRKCAVFSIVLSYLLIVAGVVLAWWSIHSATVTKPTLPNTQAFLPVQTDSPH